MASLRHKENSQMFRKCPYHYLIEQGYISLRHLDPNLQGKTYQQPVNIAVDTVQLWFKLYLHIYKRQHIVHLFPVFSSYFIFQ